MSETKTAAPLLARITQFTGEQDVMRRIIENREAILQLQQGGAQQPELLVPDPGLVVRIETLEKRLEEVMKRNAPGVARKKAPRKKTGVK